MATTAAAVAAAAAPPPPGASPSKRPSPKLPISAKGGGAAHAEDLLASLPSPSRRRGLQRSPVHSPTQMLLSSSPSQGGGSSYREQLRASGLDALHRVRAATPSHVVVQQQQQQMQQQQHQHQNQQQQRQQRQQQQVATVSKEHQHQQQMHTPTASSPVTQAVTPTQLSFGMVPTQVPLVGPGHDAAARTPPAVQLDAQLPYVAYCGGAALVQQQVVGWPDMSAGATPGFAASGPSGGAFFDMSRAPMAQFQCCDQAPDLMALAMPQAVGSALDGAPDLMALAMPRAAAGALDGAQDLMAIAMPQAAGNALDGEQIAARLRAAAPERYED